MKTYELTYIISPEITSEEAEAKAKEFESLILAKEGTILKQISPSAKPLSYQIKGRASGFFGVIEFQSEPEKMVEVKSIIEKDGKIVRHMVIIKQAAELKKERRTRTKPTALAPEPAAETANAEPKAEEKPATTKKDIKEKVELKDIEQELDEILG